MAKRDFNLWQPHYETTSVLDEKTHYIDEQKRRDAYRLSVKESMIKEIFENYSSFPKKEK